ncbi:F-box/RNI-like/FBD-like domains-containing protein [Rhynchospora pubera]|uniref:F-box/RNI-like/FBD-like domains-containing protein n=1 Tax=Rhynchospora pubera TaxID=906938 RepID=A0AAV8HYJ4_9POAL|nr:F-box/RNI-like/FBD-like domains-containing protein [Rhynchospora pubera]
MAHSQTKGLISDDAIISNLPECIKQEIVSYLPINEAVRTCVLSKSWRRIWTWSTIRDLDVDASRISSSHHNMVSNESSRIINFVDTLLPCYKGPVRKFRYSGTEPSFTVLQKWMRMLSEKHISELALEIVPNLLFVLINCSSLFSTLELKELVLGKCNILLPTETGFSGFRLLQTLDLRNCLVSGGGLTELIALCPLLRQLKISPGPAAGVLEIHAPNLQELMICGNFTLVSLLTPKLCKVNFITSPSVELRGDLIQSSVTIQGLSGATPRYLLEGVPAKVQPQ